MRLQQASIIAVCVLGFFDNNIGDVRCRSTNGRSYRWKSLKKHTTLIPPNGGETRQANYANLLYPLALLPPLPQLARHHYQRQPEEHKQQDELPSTEHSSSTTGSSFLSKLWFFTSNSDDGNKGSNSEAAYHKYQHAEQKQHEREENRPRSSRGKSRGYSWEGDNNNEVWYMNGNSSSGSSSSSDYKKKESENSTPSQREEYQQYGDRSSIKNSSSMAYHDYWSSLPIIGHFTHGIIDELQSHVHFIKPGTKWCGDGNKARSYQDVGVLYKTDTCCRDHDKCAYYILSHESKYGLYNDGHWTRSHCECDMAFYSCLKSVNTPFSSAVGYTYFNVLKMKCFKMEYPVVMCVQGNGWFSKSCSQYVIDMSKEKKWQWFDNYDF